MATTRGCLGKVKSGATPDAVGEVTAWEFTETAEEIDTSAMGACTSSSEAGSVKTTGSVTCWWDPADGGQGNLVAGDTVALELYPGGDGSGATKYSGSVVVLSRSATGGVNSVVNTTFTFTVNGALTEATVP